MKLMDILRELKYYFYTFLAGIGVCILFFFKFNSDSDSELLNLEDGADILKDSINDLEGELDSLEIDDLTDSGIVDFYEDNL